MRFDPVHDVTTLHHEADPADGGDVRDRVARHRKQAGEELRSHRACLRRLAHTPPAAISSISRAFRPDANTPTSPPMQIGTRAASARRRLSRASRHDPRRTRLAKPVAVLAGWDHRWDEGSVATSLAVFWGDQPWREVGGFAQAERVNVPDYIATRVTPAVKLDALAAAVERLARNFGTWRTPWDRINRTQRLDDAIAAHFDDARPLATVPFSSAQWGSLASFGARRWPGKSRYYGTSGDSFVVVVEFGRA